MKFEHIPAGQFKTYCLQLMDDIHTKKKGFVITKRGVPVAQIIPTEDNLPQLFGWLSQSVVEQGNIIDPINVEWDVYDTKY
jgi:hypothetical protein